MESICVAVRVRPPLAREQGNRFFHHATQTSPDDRDILLREVIPLDTPQGCEPMIIANHSFSFDSVFDCDASQADLYNRCARPATISVLEGYNACILAYGQTGTGKTFTIQGDSGESRGIIPRCLHDIFSYITSSPDQPRWTVHMSFLQIYNDTISDLLASGKPLALRQDGQRVLIENLSAWAVPSAAGALEIVTRGNAQRSTAQTKLNDMSSRSHAVLQVTVAHHRPDGSCRVGKLNLVDLAGSERVRVTGASGQRLQEGKSINQSLSALGNVVSAIVDARPHVPFRDSKLTRILEDSLGENCKFTLVVTISPASEAFAESLSTLKFAQRAKGLRARPRVNVEGGDEVHRELAREKALREKLEEKLKRLSGGERVNGNLEVLLDKQKQMLTNMTRRITSVQENVAVSQETLAVIERLEQLAIDFKPLAGELDALKKTLGISQRLHVPTLRLGGSNDNAIDAVTPSAILGKMRSLSIGKQATSGEASPSRSVDQLIAKRKQELEELRRQTNSNYM